MDLLLGRNEGSVLYKCALLIVAERALEPLDVPLAVDGVQLIAHLLHEVLVVRDDHDASVELLQRRHQRLDRVHVQVVRRLVQQQHVRLEVRDAREHHPRFLPARQRSDRLAVTPPTRPHPRGQTALDAEGPQQRPQVLLPRRRVELRLTRAAHAHLLHVLDGGEPVLQRVDVVLREVPDAQVVVAEDLARLGLQCRVQHAEEGGLADAVGAQQRDLVAHLHVERHVLEDRVLRALVRERHVRQLQDRAVVLRLTPPRRAHVQRLALRDGELDQRLGRVQNAAGGALAVLPAARVGVDGAEAVAAVDLLDPALAVQRLLHAHLVDLQLARADLAAQVALRLPLTPRGETHVLALLLLEARNLLLHGLALVVEVLLQVLHHLATILLSLVVGVVVAGPVA